VVPAPYHSLSGKRTIKYIIFVLSPSYFVDKGIILDKNEETPRIYRDFDEEYRKFRQKISLVLPRLSLF
jgi:hypothetical protein